MTHDFRCRSCNSDQTIKILELGNLPLANALLKPDELDQPESRYPLQLHFCPDCTLVQISETVPPEELFAHYLYFSSFSDTMLQHAKSLVADLIERFELSDDSLAIEVASNDGYLLQFYKQRNIPILGIEPAENIAKLAQEKGIPTRVEFFDADVASRLKLRGKQADVIHAHNVLAHVANLSGFVKGLTILLKDTGIAVIEVPYVKTMIDKVEFDTIYHEHLCYYSLTALKNLFAQYDLSIQDVKQVPLHGGSLQVYVGKSDYVQPTQAVHDMLVDEHAWGVHQLSFYQDFQQRVERLKQTLNRVLADLKLAGKSIAVYGASAKGSTLMNYFGLTSEILEYVVDRSTIKQGHFTPGNHLEILSPEKLSEDMPDYVLLLTWNFETEILEQQSTYRQQGGYFIVPIPDVRIV